MSFTGLSLFFINSAHYMFGTVPCTSLIQKYQTVKIFPAGNQSPGVSSYLCIVLLIPVMPLWYWTLPQGIFLFSITWCLMTPSAPFSIYLTMNTPQYSVMKLHLTLSLINHRWNLGIVLKFTMNGSLPLNRRRNVGSLNMRNTSMTIIKPPSLPFVWRILSSLILLQYLVPLRILLSFRIHHILYLCLLLLLLPLQSQFRLPPVAVSQNQGYYKLQKFSGWHTCPPWRSRFYIHLVSPHSIWDWYLLGLTC